MPMEGLSTLRREPGHEQRRGHTFGRCCRRGPKDPTSGVTCYCHGGQGVGKHPGIRSHSPFDLLFATNLRIWLPSFHHISFVGALLHRELKKKIPFCEAERTYKRKAFKTHRSKLHKKGPVLNIPNDISGSQQSANGKPQEESLIFRGPQNFRGRFHCFWLALIEDAHASPTIPRIFDTGRRKADSAAAYRPLARAFSAMSTSSKILSWRFLGMG